MAQIHLVRRGPILYFRIAVPRDLIALAGRSEVKISLRTSDAKIGKMRGRVLSSGLEQVFESLRSMSPSEEALHDRARSYFQAELSKSLEVAFMYPSDPAFDRETEVSWLASRTAGMRNSLASQSFAPTIRVEAAELLNPIDPTAVNVASEQFRLACNLILRAKIENNRIMQAQLEGDYHAAAACDPWFAGLTASELPPLPGEAPTVPQVGPNLGEITDRFVASKVKYDWASKTAADVKRVIKLACCLLGADKPIKSVNTDDFKRVRDALAVLPPNYMKLASNVGMGPQEAIDANKAGVCLSLKTQDKYFTMFRQIFVWAAAEEYIDKVPGANIKVAGLKSIGDEKKRQPYSDDQLIKLIHSPLYKGHQSLKCRYKIGNLIERDSYFWVPLIALHSGLRLGEILQLRRVDIKAEKDIWFFDINSEEEKTVKTQSSLRKVPIHRALVELGFLDQIKTLPTNGRLFPEIKIGADGYASHNFSKWWGRFARHIGIATNKTAFHSFRHNFIQALRSAEHPEYVNKALAGHADHTVHGQYGSTVPLAILKSAIDTIDFKIDVTHLAC